VLDLTREEIEALLWSVHVIDHAYGRDHPDDGASASAARKLEAELAAKREERAA
jgi:predicted DNA-binding transcriptional regulator YafY